MHFESKLSLEPLSLKMRSRVETSLPRHTQIANSIPPSRNRLPSLYSDFALQKSTNPDGYAVNIAAWEHALTNAARAGQISSSRTGARGGVGTLGSEGGDRHRRKEDHLVLRTDDTLLRQLESPEWGRPVALGSVFVCSSLLVSETTSLNGANMRFFDFLQYEAIQKRSMVPVQLYKSSGASLQKKQWRLIDPGALSPWNVMNWGIRQLKGIVVGSDNFESSPRLQVQELVLVQNLKVCSMHFQTFYDSRAYADMGEGSCKSSNKAGFGSRRLKC
jgi:hypothetical protein